MLKYLWSSPKHALWSSASFDQVATCFCMSSSGGMVDTGDLKSPGGNPVPVRVRPRATFVGKSTASRNALKHGILSGDLIVMKENRHDLETLRLGIYQTLCPVGALEELLVEKVINAIWRIRRLTKVESEVLSDEDPIFGQSGISKGFRGSDGTCLQVLSRYEATLERNFYRALHELQRMQGMRLGCHVLAPLAIDISNDTEEKIGFDS